MNIGFLTLGILVPIYFIIGTAYLIFSFNYIKIPDMWSPIQPLAFIIFWPLILILNTFRYIKNYITIKK